MAPVMSLYTCVTRLDHCTRVDNFRAVAVLITTLN